MTPERARDLLETQLDELNALRNAHARDPRFKQWRQATLTLIQRIWPGDTTHAERFRRIPFSPPSSKMSQKATRSFFEKGCAEAVQLIRSLVPDLHARFGAQSVNESSAPAPGEVEDDFPVLDLPGAPVVPPARADAEEADEEEETPRPARVSMRASTPPSEPRVPLREMLGFSSRPLDADDDTAPTAGEQEDAIGFEADIEATALHSEWHVDEADALDPERIETDHDIWEAPEEFPLPARPHKARDGEASDPIIEIEPENLPPAESQPESSDPEPETSPDLMAEFLRSSPVLKASARPVRRRGADAPAPTSAAAAALIAVASEVAALGVPEGQRAGMRATLIELARRVDDRSIEWDTLRESFHAVLDHPALARRVIPLLIPYLDAAA